MWFIQTFYILGIHWTLWNRSDIALTGQWEFQSRKKLRAFPSATISREIASRFVFKWRWETIVPEMWCRMMLVFCIRIRVLLSAFHFSVCNCGLNNGLWFLMEGKRLCMLWLGLLWTFWRRERERERVSEHADNRTFFGKHIKLSVVLSYTVCCCFHGPNDCSCILQAV